MNQPDRNFVDQFLSATYELCLEMHQGDHVKAKAEFDRVMDMTWEQLAEWHQEHVRSLELADVRIATLRRLSRMKPGEVLHLSIGQLQPIVAGLDALVGQLPPWQPVEVHAEVDGVRFAIKEAR